jgi:predicted ABC-type ATPase
MLRRVAPVLRRPLVRRLLSIGIDLQRTRAEETYDLALNWLAVVIVEAIIGAAIDERTDVIAETVLSTSKYLPLVERAKADGFETGMIFVALQTPERHVERVEVRVASGGHSVPPDKIRSRWEASHVQLAAFAAVVDRLLVFSNDGKGKPELVAWKDGGPVTFTEPDRLPRVRAALHHLT